VVNPTVAMSEINVWQDDRVAPSQTVIFCVHVSFERSDVVWNKR